MKTHSIRHSQLQWPLLTATILFCACSDVVFESPQPIGANDLRQLPEEYTGVYLNADSDTLWIDTGKITLSFFDKPVEINLSDTNVKLRKKGDLFILNIPSDKYWELYLGQFMGDSLEVAYMDYKTLSQEAIDWLKQHAGGQEPIPEDSPAKVKLILHPSADALEKMIQKGYFNNESVFYRKSR